MKKNLKKIFLQYPLVYVLKGVLRLLLTTCRFEIIGLSQFLEKASGGRVILALWHNRLLILPEILHKNVPQGIFRAVISNSRDGELLAILAKSYRQGRTLRVPHNSRQKALQEIISYLRHSQEVLVITPDGPRGPSNKLKPGVSVAARASSACVVPFTWTASRFWQLKTWDRLLIPKPFSKIKVVFSEPLIFQKNKCEEDSDMLEQALSQLAP